MKTFSNEQLRREAFLASRLELEVPPVVSNIETTSRCNAKCWFCPRPKRSQDLEKEVFDILLGDHFVEFEKPWLHFRGEPLLVPELLYFVDRLAKRGSEPRLSTNGVLMNDRIASQLIDSGLSQIVFSLDAVSSNVYSKIHGIDRFEDAQQGVFTFLKYSSGSSLTTVQVQMVICEANFDEWRKFVDFWGGQGVDSVHLKPLYTRAGQLSFDRTDAGFLRTPASFSPCYHLWRGLVVRADGSVGVCCADFAEALTLGNLKKDSLRSIWNGAFMRGLRRAHLDKNPSSPCSSCPERVKQNAVPGNEVCYLHGIPEEDWRLPEHASVYIHF